LEAPWRFVLVKQHFNRFFDGILQFTKQPLPIMLALSQLRFSRTPQCQLSASNFMVEYAQSVQLKCNVRNTFVGDKRMQSLGFFIQSLPPHVKINLNHANKSEEAADSCSLSHSNLMTK
jgi:hypothetical protein